MRRIRKLLVETQPKGHFDESVQDSDFLFNPTVKEVYEKIGPYQIPSNSMDHVGINLADKPPFRL